MFADGSSLHIEEFEHWLFERYEISSGCRREDLNVHLPVDIVVSLVIHLVGKDRSVAQVLLSAIENCDLDVRLSLCTLVTDGTDWLDCD